MTAEPFLKNSQRAAVILMLLDDDEAASILARLDPDELQQIGEAMAALEDVGPDWIASSIGGFIRHADNEPVGGNDRMGRMRNVMAKAVGEIKADSLMQRISPKQSNPSIELARWLAPEILTPMIEEEHPQAIAVLLLLLKPEMAAQILAALPTEIQPTVVERVAKLGPVSPHVVKMLNDMLTDRLSRRFGRAALSMGGPKEAALLINEARSVEGTVMPAIQEKDKQLADAIEAEMFKFDIILGLSPKDMGRLLRDVDSSVLIDSLKGLEESERDAFFCAMSARAADGVRDEIEERGRLKRSEVEAAQQTMIELARKLGADGEIELGTGGGDDDYV